MNDHTQSSLAQPTFSFDYMWGVLGNHDLGWKQAVNFGFISKLSRTDYNELNKPNPKALAHIGSKKSLIELGVPKNKLSLFSHVSLYWRVSFLTLSHG